MSARNPKKKILFLVVMGLFVVNSRAANNNKSGSTALKMLEIDSVHNQAKKQFNLFTSYLYQRADDTTLNFIAFEQGVRGYLNMLKINEVKVERYLTIIDFTQPSSNERLYIFDVCKQKLAYKSIVSHGQNSGGLYAKKFSNKDNSHQSSIGFYVTTTTYNSSKYKLALRLAGKEFSNNQASSRGVVMHGADYATYEFLDKYGRLGRSFGCPAMPYKNFDMVVGMIKNGSCMYIYYPSTYYQRHSKYLNKKNYLEDFI